MYKKARLGTSPLAQALRENHGMSIFVDSSFKGIKGKIQVCIISCISDLNSPRVKELLKTVQLYNWSENVDLFVLVPCKLKDVYLDILKDVENVHLVLYNCREPNFRKESRFYREMNVGDARNASLALGLVLKTDRLIVSDDDRNYITPYFNNQFNKKKGLYYWVSKDSITKQAQMNHWIKHCCNMDDNTAILGFTSQNRRRGFKGQEEPFVEMKISKKNVNCAQLVLLNMKLLAKHSETYLPIRMGEDTAFQFALSQKNLLCEESGHIMHGSPTVKNNPSTARTKRNANAKNYSPRDLFWWRKFIDLQLITKDKTKFKIQWTKNGTKAVVPDFAANNEMRKKALDKEKEKLLKKWEKFEKKKSKKLIPDDPRLTKDDNPMDPNFKVSDVTSRVLEDNSAGWQNLGELLSQIIYKLTIQMRYQIKSFSIFPLCHLLILHHTL